jgi:hypothetical protein
MRRLRIKPSHFSKVVNGKVAGLPPIPCVLIGRRQLFNEDSLEKWVLEVERNHAARLTEGR